MKLMVPTIMCEAIVAEAFESPRGPVKVGEIISMPYGNALQMRALGLLGSFKDEIAKHTEAVEGLNVYGGDCWFPQASQTISRVADFLAQAAPTASTH